MVVSTTGQNYDFQFWVKNEDVVATAPRGDAPTTSEWSTILLTKLCLLLGDWEYSTSRKNINKMRSRNGHYISCLKMQNWTMHYDVIKWKLFSRYWTFLQGIHRSPIHSPHKGQWRRALMFSLICVWTYSWVKNRDAGDLRRYCSHYGVTVMDTLLTKCDVDSFRISWLKSMADEVIYS